MAYTRDIILDDLNIGDTDRIRLTLLKNHVAWTNIDSVQLVFEPQPQEDDTQFTRDCVLESSNIWYYDLLTTDITVSGWYKLTVYFVDGVVRKKYPYEITFYVADQP